VRDRKRWNVVACITYVEKLMNQPPADNMSRTYHSRCLPKLRGLRPIPFSGSAKTGFIVSKVVLLMQATSGTMWYLMIHELGSHRNIQRIPRSGVLSFPLFKCCLLRRPHDLACDRLTILPNHQQVFSCPTRCQRASHSTGSSSAAAATAHTCHPGS
jgi:hypothetical protein